MDVKIKFTIITKSYAVDPEKGVQKSILEPSQFTSPIRQRAS